MADLQTLNIVIAANTQQATTGLNNVSKSLANTAMAAQKVDSSINKTTTNFTGLSRVLQDLPFGFIAISNNLTQLLPAAGGLGLAFSALISVITFMSTGFDNWTRGLVDNKDALKDTADAVKEVQATAGKEIASLTVLTNAAKDTNLAMSERLAAVKKLREEFPSYFADLSTEKILNGDVAAAIQATSNALFQRAVIRQKESQLGPIAGQLFDLREQRKELERQEAAMKRLNAVVGQTRDRQGVLSSLFGAGSQDRKGLSDLAKQMAAIDQQIYPLQGQFKQLAQAIIDASEAAGKGLFDPDKPDKTKQLKEKIAKEFTRNNVSFQIVDIDGTAAHFATDINRAIDKSADDIEPGVKPKKIVDLGTSQAEDIAAVLNQTLRPAIDSIFNAIASGNNVFEALGQSIKKVVARLAAAVIEAAIFSIIINTITGGGASLAGFGKIFSALAGIPKFATGQVVTRPTLAMVGEQGPERITPLNQISNSGNNILQGEVIFNISGQNLRGVLSRYDKSAFNTF